MAEALMKLAKIMSTVRVAVAFTSFISASVIFFVTSSFCCAASARVRQRGTVAAARGERGDGKIAGPSRKSCFSAGQLFDRIAVKKSSAILLFDLFVSVLLHFFILS